MLADYIKKEWIKLGAEAENWEKAIEEGGGLLLKDSVITQNYIEAMKKAVRDMGAYFVVTKNVALPHAKIEEGILETGFSIITLKNPVEFGNSDNDPVKYVFCLAIKSSNEHIEILKELSDLLEDKEFFRLLDREKDSEKIYDYLKTKKI
jgi:PTS system ascorbate-specific IIA component